MIALTLLACREPDPRGGTFVGNPELTARIAESPDTSVIDGELVAPEVLLGDCDQVGDVPLGARTLTFEGPLSPEKLQIPTGTHCGVFFVVTGFTLRIDAGDALPIRIVAQDFDLWVPTDFEAVAGHRYDLRFGDETWLAAVADAAVEGDNPIDGSNPALDEAFFSGLEAGSAVQDAPGATSSTPTPGRVDLETWPVSPLGTPTSFEGCGPAVVLDLAVPIPPAGMAAAGYDRDVGWCQASVTFSDPLVDQVAWQTDWSDASLYEVTYNGWSGGCGDLHCGKLEDASGDDLGRSCTVLAYCDGDGGTAVVRGYEW